MQDVFVIGGLRASCTAISRALRGFSQQSLPAAEKMLQKYLRNFTSQSIATWH